MFILRAEIVINISLISNFQLRINIYNIYIFFILALVYIATFTTEFGVYFLQVTLNGADLPDIL